MANLAWELVDMLLDAGYVWDTVEGIWYGPDGSVAARVERGGA